MRAAAARWPVDTRRRGGPAPGIQRLAMRKLWMLHAVKDQRELRIPPSNHLEALKGDRKGQYSIRINKQWRICFKWLEGNAYDVEIVDYH